MRLTTLLKPKKKCLVLRLEPKCLIFVFKNYISFKKVAVKMIKKNGRHQQMILTI
jgi:hypothetical protein